MDLPPWWPTGGVLEQQTLRKATTTSTLSAELKPATALPAMMNFSGRHAIWEYFDVAHPETGFYFCARCNAAYSWPPSTTVAGRHLRDKHPDLLREVRENEALRRKRDSGLPWGWHQWMEKREQPPQAGAGRQKHHVAAAASKRRQAVAPMPQQNELMPQEMRACSSSGPLLALPDQLLVQAAQSADVYHQTKRKRAKLAQLAREIADHEIATLASNSASSPAFGSSPAGSCKTASSDHPSVSTEQRPADCEADGKRTNPTASATALIKEHHLDYELALGELLALKREPGEVQDDLAATEQQQQPSTRRHEWRILPTPQMDSARTHNRKRAMERQQSDAEPQSRAEEHSICNGFGQDSDELQVLRQQKRELERRLEQMEVELGAALCGKEEAERASARLEPEVARTRAETRQQLEREKEAEMGELRAQHERRMRALEAQLDEVSALNATLVAQNGRMAAMGRNGVGSAYSLLGEQSASSALAENYRRRLAQALNQLQHNAQSQERQNSAARLAQNKAMREKLDESELGRLSAQRAQLAAEAELAQMREQLDEALTARQSADQKLLAALREKNASTALAREHGEQLQEALKRERQLAQHAQMETHRINAHMEQIDTLEKELHNTKIELSRLNASSEFTARNCVERRRLEAAELKARDAQTNLELERAYKRRVEAQATKLKDELDSLHEQLSSARSAKEREMEAQKRLRKENVVLQEELNRARRRETETANNQRTMKIEMIALEDELRATAGDLKLSNRRLEILQQTLDVDIGEHSLPSATFSSAGSELGDVEVPAAEEQETRDADRGIGGAQSFVGCQSEQSPPEEG